MNARRVLRILGHMLLVLAGAQLVPLLWCFAPGASGAIPGLVVGAAITAYETNGRRRLQMASAVWLSRGMNTTSAKGIRSVNRKGSTASGKFFQRLARPGPALYAERTSGRSR